MILIHGRGSSGEDIAGLADALEVDGFAFLAPSAESGAWYPERFFVPLAQNEPSLSRALGVVEQLVEEIRSAGIPDGRIGLIGFSQGACLALEHAARAGRRYGFVAGLSGGLIGPLETPRPAVNLHGTPVLLGCAEQDAHIPIEFVERSAVVFEAMGAEVTKQIFSGSAHTVFPTEIDWIQRQAAAIPGE
jgi:phospholipase/carboxylesterase